MKIRGIEFGTSIGASGIQGFFGEGYWYHFLWYILFPFRFTFRGMTFCAKTILLPFRKGNTPMIWWKWLIAPIQLIPSSIYVDPFKQVGANAVGLPNEGAEKSFKRRRWQERTEPFMISYACNDHGSIDQLTETKKFKDLVLKYKPEFKAPFAIQLNDSCPNLGLMSYGDKVSRLWSLLDVLGEIGVPILIKIDAFFEIEIALEIEKHPHFDGWVCSNALAWDKVSVSDRIEFFGSTTSPLEKRWNRKLFWFGRKIFTIPNAKGGISGVVIRPYVLTWIRKARAAGIKKFILGCGGITHPEHVNEYFLAGANAISPGSMAIFAPWNMKAVIRRAKELFS